MPSCTRSRSLEVRSRHRKTNFLLQSASFSLGFIFILYASIMFWNTFILQPQITNMKTNLYTLKETVNSIGAAYDNLSKDIKFLNGGAPILNEAEVNDIPINDDIVLIPSNESKMGNENYDNIKKVDKKTQKSLSKLNSIDSRTASKSSKNKRRDSFKSSNTKPKSSNTKIKTGSQYSRNSRNKYPKHKSIDENFETPFRDSKHYRQTKSNNMHTSAHMNVSQLNKRNQTSYCNTMGDVLEAGTLTENTAPESKISKNSQFVNFKEAIGLQSSDPFWNDIEFWFKEHQQNHKKQHICKSEPKPEHKSVHKTYCRHADKRRFTIPSMTP